MSRRGVHLAAADVVESDGAGHDDAVVPRPGGVQASVELRQGSERFREVPLMTRSIRGLAVAVALLAVGHPHSARATDCGRFYDPAECFCPTFEDPPAVYIGTIVLDWTTYESALLIEEVFVPPGEQPEYEVGDYLPLRDVVSHRFTDRFLVYHRDRETDVQTLMKLDVDGMLVAAAPFNRLAIEPRYCTTRLHYSVVAEALLSSSCYQVIRAEPTMPAALRCEGGGFCQSAGSSSNGAGYLAIVVVFLVLHAKRRRRHSTMACSGIMRRAPRRC